MNSNLFRKGNIANYIILAENLTGTPHRFKKGRGTMNRCCQPSIQNQTLSISSPNTFIYI